MRALALVLMLGGCAGGSTSTPTAPAAPPAGTTVVRGRFIGWAQEPGATVSVLDCKARGSQRIKPDGSFELRIDGCPPGIHHLVFGKNASGLLKFAIRGPVTDIGTIEGGQ